MTRIAPGASAPTHPASPDQPATPRRRLAPNVIAMHAEDRPPVVQHRRRGRLPAAIGSIWRARHARLYVGAICALRTPLNDDVPVRVTEVYEDGKCDIETIGPRRIVCPDGTLLRAAIASNHCLIRTATLGACHDQA